MQADRRQLEPLIDAMARAVAAAVLEELQARPGGASGASSNDDFASARDRAAEAARASEEARRD